MERPDKINHYLDIAQAFAKRSTCIRRNWGAIIVKNDEVVGSGYNGAPRGRKNCCDLNKCLRQELKVPAGRMYELCRSVHAEQNAIIQTRRQDMIDSTMYITGLDYKTGNITPTVMCCELCKRMILNAGISKVVFRDTPTEYTVVEVSKWCEEEPILDLDASTFDPTTPGY